MSQVVRTNLFVLQIMAFCVFASLANALQCEPTWHPGFDLPGVTGTPTRSVASMAVFNDGSGPALYVGGGFNGAGGQPANYIARWDGSVWSPLGSGFNGDVRALTVFDDGTGPSLYAGGSFWIAGGHEASRIAKWDGAEWSPVGPGVDNSVDALAVYDDGSGPALYAAGTFTNAGEQRAFRIAKWDGSVWSPLGSGIGGPNSAYPDKVLCLAVFDDGNGPALYAGGDFTEAGGRYARGIARWDGENWSPVGTGVVGDVYALAVYDIDGNGPSLFVGGSFTSAGGQTASRIAQWNGTEWQPLGVGVNSWVLSIVGFEDDDGPVLYVGGQFNSAGGQPINSLARWDGTDWSPLIGAYGLSVGGSFPIINGLAIHDDGSSPALYVGGSFTIPGGGTGMGIAKWDGLNWRSLGKGISNGSVSALSVFTNESKSSIVAGGTFNGVDGKPARNIAQWDGTEWSTLGSGVNSTILALAIFNDGQGTESSLYAAGSFTEAGGNPANYIAKWDGTDWSPLGSGVAQTSSPFVYSLEVFDDGLGNALYAGGKFITAGGQLVNHIARWDGIEWSALSGPVGTGLTGSNNTQVRSLAEFNDGSGPALFVGGNFTAAGGKIVNHIARWDGYDWSPLAGPGGTGVSGAAAFVYSMAVYDDGSGPALYIGGQFTTVGGLVVNNIARWDGNNWSPLIGSDGTGVNGTVFDLAVYDDGAGPVLYAGGSFTTAGGQTVNRVARWDGVAWSPLASPNGTGVNGVVNDIAMYNDGSGPAIYIGGGFSLAGGVGSSKIAKWQGCEIAPPVCIGDIADDFGFTTADEGGPDGVVDFGDFVALLGLIGPCKDGMPGCLGDIADDFGFTTAEGGHPDGVVDFGDFVALLGLIGPCP